MCWDYSECGVCGEKTYCIIHCNCSEEDIDNGYCPHKDCKLFNQCDFCYLDICDYCYSEGCSKCGKHHCNECSKKSHA